MPHYIRENIKQIQHEIGNSNLVVVSKYRTIEELREVYASNHRDFGENRIQEMVKKREILPQDIKWHMIGHLQTNKVKYIAPFIHLIHSVDSLKLVKEINKQGKKNNRMISILLQIHIAQETQKFGFTINELEELIESSALVEFQNIKIKGLMGMATNTTDQNQIRAEFNALAILYRKYQEKMYWDTLSMGMSNDYKIACDCGSNLLRIGSKIFNKQ